MDYKQINFNENSKINFISWKIKQQIFIFFYILINGIIFTPDTNNEFKFHKLTSTVITFLIQIST